MLDLHLGGGAGAGEHEVEGILIRVAAGDVEGSGAGAESGGAEAHAEGGAKAGRQTRRRGGSAEFSAVVTILGDDEAGQCGGTGVAECDGDVAHAADIRAGQCERGDAIREPVAGGILDDNLRCDARSGKQDVEWIFIGVIAGDVDGGRARAERGGRELHGESGGAAGTAHRRCGRGREGEIIGMGAVFGDGEAREVDIAGVSDREAQTGAGTEQNGTEAPAAAIEQIGAHGLFDGDFGREAGSGEIDVKRVLIGIIARDTHDGAASTDGRGDEGNVESGVFARIERGDGQRAQREVCSVRARLAQSEAGERRGAHIPHGVGLRDASSNGHVAKSGRGGAIREIGACWLLDGNLRRDATAGHGDVEGVFIEITAGDADDGIARHGGSRCKRDGEGRRAARSQRSGGKRAEREVCAIRAGFTQGEAAEGERSCVPDCEGADQIAANEYWAVVHRTHAIDQSGSSRLLHLNLRRIRRGGEADAEGIFIQITAGDVDGRRACAATANRCKRDRKCGAGSRGNARDRRADRELRAVRPVFGDTNAGKRSGTGVANRKRLRSATASGACGRQHDAGHTIREGGARGIFHADFRPKRIGRDRHIERTFIQITAEDVNNGTSWTFNSDW